MSPAREARRGRFQVAGTIEDINEYGVKVDGRWYNYSKVTTAHFDDHDAGDVVTLDVEEPKFIMRLTRTSPSGQQAGGRTVRIDGRTGGDPKPAKVLREIGGAEKYDETGELTALGVQARIAAVASAVAFHKDSVSEGTVIATATIFEDYIWNGVGAGELEIE